MFKTLEVTAPSAATGTDDDLGLRGDEAAAPRARAEGRVPLYGKYDCPYGWVCVAEQHAHDLSPLVLIDVYGLPEEDGH